MINKAIEIIKRCLDTKRQVLDLNNLGLTDEDFLEDTRLYKLLKGCAHITELDLSKNKLNVIFDLEGLTGLKELYLGNNQINKISGLGKLANLTILDLSRNQISVIEGLETLSNLKTLWLANNQIKETNGLHKLFELLILDLSNNAVNAIADLTHLTKLQKLRLFGNQINSISGLSSLTNLQQLNISHNLISDISELLSFLQRKNQPLKIVTNNNFHRTIEGEINAYGNPLTSPPIQVVELGNTAILRYFAEELKAEYEAKLLIVGEPEAGKTSLMKKITNSNYLIPNQEDSTIGIQVVKWSFEHMSTPEKISVNCWDFGGQEMQYLTHQFFLSADAMYVLLTSARKDYDNLDYWFNIIALLGKNEKNENSELLVVGNEIQMKEGQATKTFDKKKYEDTYPHLPFGFLAVNLATKADVDGRFATLVHTIKEKIVNLPVMAKKLPVKWGVVRNQFNLMQANYLQIAQYFMICQQAGINEALALDLATYLHKIGEAVYFHNDHTINQFIILSPKWAVDGVYSILKTKEIVDNDGHFTQQQVFDILEKACYKFEEKNLLLGLMVKDNFEVAYKIPGTKDEYIAPQLLPIVQPEYVWQKKGALHFQYLYPFMPKGILTRLIVRLHQDIMEKEGKGLVWRSGVIIQRNGCFAKIEEIKKAETGQQVIAIQVQGHTANRKLLLYDICRAIEGIHKDSFANIRFFRQVPCNCSHCRRLEEPFFHDYELLMKLLEKNKKEIMCQYDVDNEPLIKDLLEHIFEVDFMHMFNMKPRKNSDEAINLTIRYDPFNLAEKSTVKKKMFISYSKHDEDFKEEFCKHLVTLKEQDLLESFSCKQIDLGADWDATIQKEIDICDIMVCLVSVDFLNTDYIRKYEIEKAMQSGKRLIPIPIKPCDWETSNIGSLYAPLRGRYLSLDPELLLRNIIKENTAIERAAWWTAIVKELREKVFQL